jgi:uncharacterized RDD family membrane protein YckC
LFRRAIAFAVDALLFLPVWIFEILNRGEAWSVFMMAFVSLTSWCGVWVYRLVFHALLGTTVGKWIVGLRVVGLDNRRPAFLMSALRETPFLVLATIFVLPYYLGHSDATIAFDAAVIKVSFFALIFLDIATSLLRGDGRTLHDLIGKTCVVGKQERMSANVK